MSSIMPEKMDEEVSVDDETGALLQESFKVMRNYSSKVHKAPWSKILRWALLVLITPFTIYGFIKALESLSNSLGNANGQGKVAIQIGQKVIYGENKQVKFSPDRKFEGPSADEIWKSLQPVGGGFIKVAEEDRKGLGPPVHLFGNQGYCISAFHQLHCLSSLHNAFYESSQNRSEGETIHLEHCFDFLRQAIMCHADTTLEHAEALVPEQNAVSGWDVVHQCRDWDAVAKFATENSISTS